MQCFEWPDVLCLEGRPRAEQRRFLGSPDEAEHRLFHGLVPWGQSRWGDLRARVESHGVEQGGRMLRAVDDWGRALDDDGESDARQLLAHLYERRLHAYMGARLMVAGPELGDEAIVQVSHWPSSLVRFADNLVTFFGLPFDEAVTFFERKRLVSTRQFDSIQDTFKRDAFVARLLATSRLQEAARATVTAGIRHGWSTAEIVMELERTIGIMHQRRADEERWRPGMPETRSMETSRYLETVARTNVATAYGAGRFEQMTEPEIRMLRPFVQYLAARDDRVRRMHRRLHGLVFKNGGPIHLQYTPPKGYSCRCVTRTLSLREMGKLQLVATTRLVDDPRTGLPYRGDRGFEHSVALPLNGASGPTRTPQVERAR